MNLTRRFFLGGVAATVAIPVSGAIVAGVQAAAPVAEPAAEFLPCWGQRVSRAQYAKLFNFIGETFGPADDETFTLPDLRGRIAIGGQSWPVGLTGTADGSYSHSIIDQALSPHTHTFTSAPSRHTHIWPTAVTLDTIIATGFGSELFPAGYILHVAGKVPLV